MRPNFAEFISVPLVHFQDHHVVVSLHSHFTTLIFYELRDVSNLQFNRPSDFPADGRA